MFGFRPDQILLNICMTVNHFNKNFPDFWMIMATIYIQQTRVKNNDNGQYILGDKFSLKLVSSKGIENYHL